MNRPLAAMYIAMAEETREEELGYQIQINNDISKEGDSPYDIEINNLKQSYIDQSKMLKDEIRKRSIRAIVILT